MITPREWFRTADVHLGKHKLSKGRNRQKSYTYAILSRIEVSKTDAFRRVLTPLRGRTAAKTIVDVRKVFR